MVRYVKVLMAFVAALVFGCTNPATIGTDFIGSDLIDIVKTDSITVSARTVAPGPIKVFEGTPNFRRYLLGNLDDEYFGTSEAQVFGQLRARNSLGPIVYDRIDSVVLSLEYDSTGFYGNTRNDRIQRLEVFRLTEDMDRETEYFSDDVIATEAEPLGVREDFLPNPSDPTIIRVPDGDGGIDTVALTPQLRVRLDESLGEEILNYDSLALANNDEFIKLFKGINIRAENENSMMSFNLLSNETRMSIFYRDTSGNAREKVFQFSNFSALFPHFSHDHSGTVLEQAINNPEFGDSLLFVQGMAGVELEVEIPNLEEYEGLLTNISSIEYTAAPRIQDNLTNIFPVPRSFTAARENEDGLPILIIDAALAESQSTSEEFLDQNFGGFVSESLGDDGELLQEYRMSITQFVDAVRRGERENTFRIRPRLKNISANRAIICGPEHSKYPMKFELILSTP